MIKKIMSLIVLFSAMSACSAAGNTDAASQSDSLTTDTTQMDTTPVDSNSVKAEIETTVGNFTILLYGDTPKHRDNFVKLAKEGYYDGTLFHRVISNFMVQAGDPDSKNAPAGKMLGSGDPGYTIEAEIVYPKHFHKRGAIAAARTGDAVNPERRSSGSQFYVVTGDKYTDAQLNQMDMRLQQSQMQSYFNSLCQKNMDKIRALQQAGDAEALRALQEEYIAKTEEWAKDHAIKMTPEMRQAYSTVGGTPHLDNEYTVFGEVLSGMDVVEKIEKAETDSNDRPTTDIKILHVKILD